MEEAHGGQDLPTGPKDAHSTVLSIEEEAIIVAFRKHTLLPVDDCLYALYTGRQARWSPPGSCGT